MEDVTFKEERAARVAHVLARSVRQGEVNAVDALRILKHELRRLNTNRSHLLSTRSTGAQASIEKYAPDHPPRNDSDDALHADHVYSFTVDILDQVTTFDARVLELRKLAIVVGVTAKENYVLESLENAGQCGPEKYAAAGVTFATPVPWQATDATGS